MSRRCAGIRRVGDPSTPFASLTPLGMTCSRSATSMSSRAEGRRPVVEESPAQAKLCLLRQPEIHTVHPATACETNCTSDDNRRFKLCLWRQPMSQTVHLATTRACFGPLVVAGCTVWVYSCRQRHSLARRLSPEVQFVVQSVVRCTVWLARCRQMHSLTGTLSPDAQFPADAVTVIAACSVAMPSENGISFAGMGYGSWRRS